MASKAAPLPTALENLGRELPDLGRQQTGGLKSAADADFSARLGAAAPKQYSITAPALAAAPSSNRGLRGLRPFTKAISKLKQGIAAVVAPAAAKRESRPSGINPGLRLGFAAAATISFGALTGGVGNLLVFAAMIVPSMILHEMGHAKSAELLGDSGPREDGRLSFTPRGLMTHIDPIMTFVMPVVTMLLAGFMFGGAKPVLVQSERFKNPTRDMAIVAFAGPAVNLTLALAGGIAYTALGALGAPALAALVGMFVSCNVMLAVFNLIPVFPLDGHHLLRFAVDWLFGWQAAQRLEGVWQGLARSGLSMLVILLVSRFLSPVIVGVSQSLTGLFLSAFAGFVGSALTGGAAAPRPDGSAAPAPAEEPAGPAADLKLPASEAAVVSAFTSSFHDSVAAKFGAYEFTVRDYYAWARFIRFFTPSLGVREAVRRGAVYVYGDRLENDAELRTFSADLDSSLKSAIPENSPLARHGIDKAEAQRLLRLAEPDAQSIADDEESPFHIPLADLVPKMASVDLVTTPTTLRRIEAAYQAFSMRDFALLLGPPATQKSAIPKYLAAKLKVPHLAVTMHPGIGTFELVGGYRPKVVQIAGVEKAKEILKRALAKAEAAGEYSEIMESAVKVYGGATLEAALKAVEQDLSGQGRDASRRLLTLAHGLEYGASSLVWQDGYLTYALKRDIWITFEEINAAPTESQEFLNDFMRTRRLVISQKLGESQVLSPKPGGRFMLWATMNPETDPNREVLAKTLKNRWRVKSFGHLPPFEQAEIIEKKYGVPTNWALALVENFHKELHRQAANRLIGDQWRDGYEINLRHLMKVCRRWKGFVDQEQELSGFKPDQKRQLFLLAREAFSVYGGMMRTDNERQGVFTMLDQALRLGANGWTKPDDLRVRPDRIEDVGDAIRIGDVTLPKGRGGDFVPKPNPDYLVDAAVLERLYEYAKALSAGEPLLVMGESAAGKTSDLEYLFFRMNMNLRYKNLDSDTAIEEVIGGYAPGARRGGFSYQEGMLPRAMEERSGAFLDEFNLNPLVEWLNTVVDDDRLYLPHRIVSGHPYIVAAANPPETRYPGRVLLSPATRSRYTERWAAHDASPARLSKLMSHWLAGGTVYAALLAFGSALHWAATSPAAGLHAFGGGPSQWLERLKGLFRSKKKASESDEELALPPTLEELLKANRVPEVQWGQYREKVSRVQTVMRMVGSAIGRDSTLKWEPGELWAFFPGENKATYPFEHLVTHTEEELVGVIDHESLHREATVLDERFPLVRKYAEDPIKHFLWNGLEDPRINSRGVHRLPGSQRYLHALYDRYLPENLQAKPDALNASPDLSQPQGDGGTGFDPKTLQYPHVEFVMAANYYWRHGKKPPKFLNASAEKAFDAAKPDMDAIFSTYARDSEPTRDQQLAYTLEALKRIDEKVLPLYEPLVKESEKKVSKERKGKGKGGKGSGSGKSQPGGAPKPGGQGKPPSTPPPPSKEQAAPRDKPEEGGSGAPEPKDKPDEKKEGRESGAGSEPEKEDPQARRILEDQARQAAEKLGGKIKENPKRPKGAGVEGKDKKPAPSQPGQAGSQAPKALTIEEIAQTQRQQLLDRSASPYQRAYEAVAHLSNSMVTHLENVFLKNSRARDVGFYKQGKRPDVKRYMKRQGEGGVRDDYMLRRAQKTKRRYKVTLLVDESGSMENFRREAINSVVLFVDSLTRLQIDVEVIGFSSTARIHKQFSEPLTPLSREKLIEELQASIGSGNTHDADALKLAIERQQAEVAEGKFIFVITDGHGNGPSKLPDVLPLADKESISVIGVGIGEGMSYVATAYPRHVAVPDIDQLPATLRARLVEDIQRQETGEAPTPAAALAVQPGGAAGLNAFSAGAQRPPRDWERLGVGVVLTVYSLGMTAAAFYGGPVAAGLILLALIMGAAFGPREMATLANVGLYSFFTALLPWPPVIALLALAFAAFGVYDSRPSLVKRWGLIDGELRHRLWRARPDLAAWDGDTAAQSRVAGWSQDLLARGPRRLRALRVLEGRPEAAAFGPMASLLARDDPWPAGQKAAANILGELERSRLEQERWAAENARLAQVAAASAAKDADASLIPAAQARLQELEGQESLPARLRRAAIEEAVAAARAPQGAEEAALAATRLRELLEPAFGAPGLGVLPLGGKPSMMGLTAAGILAYMGLLSALSWLAPGGWVYAVGAAALFFDIYVKRVLRDMIPWNLFMFVSLVVGRLAADPRMGPLVMLAPLIPCVGFGAAYYTPDVERWLAPLPGSLVAALRAAGPDPSSAWSRGLRSWKKPRLKALRAMALSGKALEYRQALELLAGQAPDAETRFAVVDVLRFLAVHDAEALAGLRRLAARPSLNADVTAYIGRALAEAEAGSAQAAVQAAQLNEATRLARESQTRDGAFGPLLGQAQALLAGMNGASLTQSVRKAAVSAALGELRAAVAVGDHTAAGVAAQRLQEQLDGAAAAGAPGLAALPYAARSWLTPGPLALAGIVAGTGAVFGAVSLFHLAALKGVFSLIALVTLLMSSHGRDRLVVGAFFVSASAWVACAAASIHHSVGAFAGVLIFNLAVAADPLQRWISGRLGYPDPASRRSIMGYDDRDNPQLRLWLDALASTSRERAAALAQMRRNPGQAAALRPILQRLLLGNDPLFSEGVIDLLEVWGDEEAESVLSNVSRTRRHKAAMRALQALEAVRRAREATKRLDVLAGMAQPPAGEDAARLLERARLALAENSPASLAGQLRRAALQESAAALGAAADPQQRAVAARRLEEQLDGAAAAGAAGLGAWPSSLRPWRSPALLTLLSIVGSTAAIFALVWGLDLQSWRTVFGFGTLISFLSTKDGAKDQRLFAGAFFVLLAAWVAAASVSIHMGVIGWAALTFLYLGVMFSPLNKRISGDMGYPDPMTRYTIKRSGDGGDRQVRAWLDGLAGMRGERAKAFEQMRRQPARAETLRPMLQTWVMSDSPMFNDGAIEMLEAWGDDVSLMILQGAAGSQAHSAAARARAAVEAVARNRQALQQMARLSELAAEVRKDSSDSLLERAHLALEAMGTGGSLSENLRRAALEEAVAALKAAPGPEERAVAARRLEGQLDGGAEGAASGLGALPASALLTPGLAAGLIIAGATTAVFFLLAALMPAVIEMGSFFMLGGIVAMVVFWNSPKLSSRRYGITTGLTLIACSIAVASLKIGMAAMGWFCITFLLLRILWPALRDVLAAKRGYPDFKTVFSFRGDRRLLKGPPEARAWMKALLGDRAQRAAAFAEMKRQPDLARSLMPILRDLLIIDDPLFNDDIVDLMARWADSESERVLRGVAGMSSHSASAAARRALEELAAAKAAVQQLDGLAALARDKAAAASDPLLEQARRAQETLGEGFSMSDKLKKAALEAAVAELRAAPDAEARAVAARRLEELLRYSAGDAGGLQAFASYNGVVLVPGQSLGEFQPKMNPGLAMMGAAVAYFFIGALAHWTHPLPFFGAMALAWGGIIVGDRRKRMNIEKPLANVNRRRLKERAGALASARNAWWINLAPSLMDSGWAGRGQALEVLRTGATPGDRDLAGFAHLLALAETTPDNMAAAVRVIVKIGGAPAAEALKDLMTRSVPAGVDLGKALAQVEEDERRAEPGVGALAVAVAAPNADAEPLLAAAGQAVAALAEDRSISGSLRRAALEEAAAALRAARLSEDPQAQAVASQRLRQHLAGASDSGAPGLAALPGGPRGFRAPWTLELKLRGAWLGAALSCVLAVGVALALPGSLLFGTLGGGAALSWLLRPVRYATGGIVVAPRSFEWAGRERMAWLMERLGVEAERSPRVGLYEQPGLDPALRGHGGLAVGGRLGPEAVVAVGEKTAEGSPEILTAVLAHELGHLRGRDVFWAAVGRRLRRLALASAAFSGVWLFASPVLLPLALCAALATSAWLLGLSHLRQAELRADLFAAWASHPAWVESFLRFLSERGVAAGLGHSWIDRLLSTHPAPARRLANLNAHRRP